MNAALVLLAGAAAGAAAVTLRDSASADGPVAPGGGDTIQPPSGGADDSGGGTTPMPEDNGGEQLDTIRLQDLSVNDRFIIHDPNTGTSGDVLVVTKIHGSGSSATYEVNVESTGTRQLISFSDLMGFMDRGAVLLRA